MSSTKAVIARHDAAERMTYALLADDPTGVAEAHDLLRQADELDASDPSDEVRDAVIANDPITAACVGWLNFPGLLHIVAEDPERYLTAAEAEAFLERGSSVLRIIVRSRLDGLSFENADKRLTKGTKDHYRLAARGVVKDQKKLRRLLVEQGLLSDEDL